MIRSRLNPRPIHSIGTALLLFAPLFTAQAALADSACGDKTCPKGFTCEPIPAGCPLVDCADESCPPCEPELISVCRPGPCLVDSDCADGMVCAESKQTDCTGPGASGGAEECERGGCSETPAEPSCATTTIRECLPRWLVACAADTDCGAGFTCKEQQQCSCTGSGSAPSAGAGSSDSSEPSEPASTPPDSQASPEREPEDCSCEPTGAKACEAVRVACAADAECPSGWSCRDNPEGTCWGDSTGARGCTPADPAKLCFPPFSDVLDRGVGGIATDAADTPSIPKGESGSGAPNASAASGGGGCSIGAARPGAFGGLLALGGLLAAALGMGVRRRAARRSSELL